MIRFFTSRPAVAPFDWTLWFSCKAQLWDGMGWWIHDAHARYTM